MKTIFKAALLLAASIAPIPAKTQTLFGTWNGKLKTPAGSLELMLNISQQNDKAITKLDVPVQGAKDLPASTTTVSGDTLYIDFAMMRASYKGVFSKDSLLIKGTWLQGGTGLPLIFDRAGKSGQSLRKKQEPVPPFPYKSEDVTFENKKAGIKIAGTLTLPRDQEKCMAVVLITGSGPQNRDEQILGHKPFMVIADYLTRKGFAVLRCDDRGVGGSTGNLQEATTLDFATDVEAALAFLKTRNEIDPAKIGLAGHSEGGIVAPIVASRNNDVAFVVLMAAPGLKGEKLLVLQAANLSRAGGMSEDAIAQASAVNKRIYAEAIANAPNAQQSIKTLLLQSGMDEENAGMQSKAILTPWYRNLLLLDPADYLPKVSCPVLAINGKKDLQVPYKENLEAIDKLLLKNKSHTVKAYDNHNHLFQHSATGLPSEYGMNEETFSPEALEDISNWLSALK